MLDALGKRAVLSKLQALRSGCLVLVEGNERHRFGKPSLELPEPVIIHVHDPRLYGDVAFGGSVGAGEAYMRGYWTSAQLVDVVRLFVLNMAALDGLEGGLAAFDGSIAQGGARPQAQQPRRFPPQHRRALRPRQRFLPPVPRRDADVLGRHVRVSAGSRCTTRRSRASTASAASSIFGPRTTCSRSAPAGAALALHAARNFGCRVTTTTISREQWKLARERVREAGLEGRIEVLCEDYRDLSVDQGSRYDKLVSIEMIEAIGDQHYDTYFSAMRRPAGARRRDAAPVHHDCRPAL